MNVCVLHGSPRKGNTYKAARIFLDELEKQGAVKLSEFIFPRDLPKFCIGCHLCLGNPREKCPHSGYVAPVYDAIIAADAIVVTSPHYGASLMPAGLKNLFDHLDFLTMTITPRPEMFGKKAFVITTGSGSASTKAPIVRCLRNWGINRVYSIALRMFTDKWDNMKPAKLEGYETALRRGAKRFYVARRRPPYAGTVFFYYMSRFILRKFVGKGAYPYEYWTERGFFKKSPFGTK